MTRRSRQALPYVQPAALTPELRDEAHDGDLKVSDFRARSQRPRSMSRSHRSPSCDRVTIKGLFFVALTAFAAWLIISQLADIGLSTIIDELQAGVVGVAVGRADPRAAAAG